MDQRARRACACTLSASSGQAGALLHIPFGHLIKIVIVVFLSTIDNLLLIYVLDNCNYYYSFCGRLALGRIERRSNRPLAVLTATATDSDVAVAFGVAASVVAVEVVEIAAKGSFVA